jgi:hypothetical protein
MDAHAVEQPPARVPQRAGAGPRPYRGPRGRQQFHVLREQQRQVRRGIASSRLGEWSERRAA